MTISIALITLLSTFATSTPNLCDDVYMDPSGLPITDALGQMLSRFCEPAGPDAPTLDLDVCCIFAGDSASCTLPDASGRCTAGERQYCEFGTAGTRTVSCLQPFPSACEFGWCVQPPEVPPPSQAHILCCQGGGACTFAPSIDAIIKCEEGGGAWLWCDNGVSNTDGTVDCWD